MKPLSDQFDEELERLRASGWQNRHPSASDPAVDGLMRVAQRLRTTTELRADSTFARRLEQQLHAHQAALHRAQQRAKHQDWPIPGGWRVHPWLSAVAALCLVLLLSVGVLAAARGVDNPDNPLYGIKVWEQQVQNSPASSASSQAEQHLQFARDRLNALSALADGGQDAAYQQTLREFDQQLTLASQQISNVPAGTDHNRLTQELATLKSDAIAVLHGLLLHLNLREELTTTDELDHLGEAVSQVASVEVTLPAHPNGQATVTLQGTSLQFGAQLLVDEKPKTATGTLKGNTLVFVVEQWTGSQHPQSIGIVNPDGTATQSTNVTVTTAPDKGNGHGNGNGDGNGSGNG
ncbi:MAG TPA: DUF5667 domain-containing protein, partial [Ktedonobacterales bacterium]